MARQAGLDYFPMAVDMLNDDKVYAIMAEAGGGNRKSAKAWVAKAWVDEILAQIYGHGYALELTRGAMEDLAHDLGITEARLEDFLGMCARHGLFDANLWVTARVLTSTGIQKRYAIACKRSVRSLVGPWILDDEDASPRAEGVSPENRRNVPKSPEIDRSAPKNAAKEKEKEKEKETTATTTLPMQLGCMAVAEDEDSVCLDLERKPHRTMLGCVMESYRQAGGARAPELYAADIASACPQGCRGDPQKANACFDLVMSALRAWDPRKVGDPWPLTAKILKESR